MKRSFTKVLFLATLPFLAVAAGCGDAGRASNPKVEGNPPHAVKPLGRPDPNNVGPVDAKGKPRSLVTEN